MSLIQLLDLFRPELFGGIGITLIFISLIQINYKVKQTLILTYFAWLLLTFIEFSGTKYYIATRDIYLDATIFLHTVMNFTDLWPVLMSEIQGGKFSQIIP